MKDYKEKIRKLLALAESANEFEAKDALLKAKRLMAEHKIEEIDLVDVQNKKVKRIVTEFEYTKRGEWWIGTLAQIIAENYCCRCAGSRYSGAQKRTIIFIGLDGDVDVCAQIFAYAIDTARKCGKEYIKSRHDFRRCSSAEKNKIKNSYAAGFVKGVKEAFEEQKRSNESEWGLVMLVPKEVNDACSSFVTDRYVSTHSIYASVHNEGREEGRRFNPSRRLGDNA